MEPSVRRQRQALVVFQAIPEHVRVWNIVVSYFQHSHETRPHLKQHFRSELGGHGKLAARDRANKAPEDAYDPVPDVNPPLGTVPFSLLAQFILLTQQRCDGVEHFKNPLFLALGDRISALQGPFESLQRLPVISLHES